MYMRTGGASKEHFTWVCGSLLLCVAFSFLTAFLVHRRQVRIPEPHQGCSFPPDSRNLYEISTVGVFIFNEIYVLRVLSSRPHCEVTDRDRDLYGFPEHLE